MKDSLPRKHGTVETHNSPLALSKSLQPSGPWFIYLESQGVILGLRPIILQFEEKHFWMDPIKMDYVISEYCSLYVFLTRNDGR